MTLYLTESDVAQLADMDCALQAVKAAHIALAQGRASDIARQRTRTKGATQHILQAAWPERGVMGYKAYTSSAQGARFWLHLFDSETGEPLAVIEADRLGMLRTGAAGGVAAQCLAREDAGRLGVIGAGWQAAGQILALAKTHSLQSVSVYARQADKLADFCLRLSQMTNLLVAPVSNGQQAVQGADIVVTATTSPKPVLEGAWLEKGMHINAVGSNSLARRELDEKAVSRADIICVDNVQTALGESGDLLLALEKGRTGTGQWIELGQVLAGFRTGRTDKEDITLFESQGLCIQDIALGTEVFERARAAGLGQTLPY